MNRGGCRDYMLTHKELVKRATIWLVGAGHCGAVLSEISSAAMENPDAIGWQSHKSIVVECKASRADFLAQRNKPSVRIGRLVGNERYFLCESGIIKPEDLEGTDYGLIYVDGKYCRTRTKAKYRSLSPQEHDDERTMLVSALRRMQTRQFLTLIP